MMDFFTLFKQEVPSNEPTKPGKLLRCPHEGCSKVFRSSPGYRYHLRSHDTDPRPHVCHVCQKKFKSANGLKYHLRKAHHIEPVASKPNANNNNNNNNNANSPKDNRESLSSEEDHMFNLNDSFNNRGYVNGGGGSYSSDRTSSIPPSPLVKSPHGLNSPLHKGGILSPLIKSPLDLTQYLSPSSAGSGAQSPYVGQDRYGQFFERRPEFMRNGDFVRNKFGQDDFDPRSPSLSEYTQQCTQANREFRDTCHRLSTSDPRLPSVDFNSQRSCEFYNRQRSGVFPSTNYPDFNNHHKKNCEEPQYTSLNDVKGSSLTSSGRLFSPYKDLPIPNEGKQYPGGLLNQNMPCASSSCSVNNTTNSSCSYPDARMDGGFSNMLNLPTVAKSQCSLQNTEQIVPDISSPGCNLSPPRTYDRNNNNAKRGASESSIETEMSDSVFQNENSNFSPIPPPTTTALSPVLPSPDIIKKLRTDSESSKDAFPGVIIYYHIQHQNDAMQNVF